jgi:hypothetical protein
VGSSVRRAFLVNDLFGLARLLLPKEEVLPSEVGLPHKHICFIQERRAMTLAQALAVSGARLLVGCLTAQRQPLAPSHPVHRLIPCLAAEQSRLAGDCRV